MSDVYGYDVSAWMYLPSHAPDGSRLIDVTDSVVDFDELLLRQYGERATWRAIMDDKCTGVARRAMAMYQSATHRGDVRWQIKPIYSQRHEDRNHAGHYRETREVFFTVWSDGGEHTIRPYWLRAKLMLTRDGYGVTSHHPVMGKGAQAIAIVGSNGSPECTAFMGNGIGHMLSDILTHMVTKSMVETFMGIATAPSRLPAETDVPSWAMVAQWWRSTFTAPEPTAEQVPASSHAWNELCDKLLGLDGLQVLTAAYADVLDNDYTAPRAGVVRLVEALKGFPVDVVLDRKAIRSRRSATTPGGDIGLYAALPGSKDPGHRILLCFIEHNAVDIVEP